MTVTHIGTRAPIYRNVAQLGWLFEQAEHHQMPAPAYTRTSDQDWTHCPNLHLTFDSLSDLTAWAMWAEAVIKEIVTDEFIGYEFEGAINEVRISAQFYCDERATA